MATATPAAPSLEGIPPDTVLPIWAARPNPLDVLGLYKRKLAPAQLTLLAAFQWLNFTRKAVLTHGTRDNDSITYQMIRQAVDEQVRELGQRSDNTLPLEDTTKSDFA